MLRNVRTDLKLRHNRSEREEEDEIRQRLQTKEKMGRLEAHALERQIILQVQISYSSFRGTENQSSSGR